MSTVLFPLSHQLPIWCAVGDKVVGSTYVYFYSVPSQRDRCLAINIYIWSGSHETRYDSKIMTIMAPLSSKNNAVDTALLPIPVLPMIIISQ